MKGAATLVATLIAATCPAWTLEALADGPPTEDCGTLAVAALLHVEGRQADLARVAAGLPTPRPAEGYSLGELRDASRRSGLDLRGVRFLDRDRRPDRPALVHLRRGDHGHYVVIRPVGHTARLVQILDPPREPRVIDYATLSRSPEWTGFGLIPSRPPWAARAGIAVALTAGGAALAWRRGARHSRLHPARP